MKKCELCNFTARSYCESDDAHLCWSCDDKVHGANFLVARHTRTLLCRNCQSLTPWKASGPNLGRTVSVCNRCINNRNRQEQDESEADDDNFTDEDDDLAADVQGGRINGENQVVPLSPTTAPPAVSSSSSSHISSQELPGRSNRAESSVDGMKYFKQALNDNTDSSSGRMSRSRPEIENPGVDGGGGRDGEVISVNLSSPLKELKTWVNSGSRSASNIKIKEGKTLDLSARRNVRRRIEGGS